MRSHRTLLRQRLNKWIFCLPLLFIGCQEYTCYHSYQPVPQAGWSRNDTLFYPLTSPLPPGKYELQIGIRHLESYYYRDIWLGISHNLKDSTRYETDTLHLYLANEKGDWYGDGIGGLMQFTQDLPTALSLQDSTANRIFQIFHLMNDSVLRSIYDVGIKLSVAP